MSSSAAWVRWAARRSSTWRAEASGCSASSVMHPATTAAPPMAARASFEWDISSIPLMSRCCGMLTGSGVSSNKRRELLHVTGIAEIGPPNGTLIKGTLGCAQSHGLRHEVLAASELMRRFPAFSVPPDYVAVVQPDGG